MGRIATFLNPGVPQNNRSPTCAMSSPVNSPSESRLGYMHTSDFIWVNPCSRIRSDNAKTSVSANPFLRITGGVIENPIATPLGNIALRWSQLSAPRKVSHVWRNCDNSIFRAEVRWLQEGLRNINGVNHPYRLRSNGAD